MTNAASFDYKDLQAILGPVAADLPRTITIAGISTDTRTLQPGNAFIALHGENFDGHDYIEKALEGGASLVIVDNENGSWALGPGSSLLRVSDTLQALGSFAWYHRRRFSIPVIAIGGASGKTSTKDLVAHVLSQSMTVLKTQANYNNQVGTPLTLLQLTRDHQAAVIEIGTNEPGEIEILSAMVQPTHGLITTIGPEHLEKLIDLDGVEREETALFDYLNDHGGVCLVNIDDERLRRFAVAPKADDQGPKAEDRRPRTVTFGLDRNADIHPTVSFDDELHPTMHIVKDHFTFRATMHTVGLASALNATAAIAVAWVLGLGSELAKQALATYQPPTGSGYARMRVQRIGALTILNDSYNANPESMALSLRTLQLYRATRRIAVLGDMRELGKGARVEHEKVLSQAMSVADIVMLFGPEFESLVGDAGLVFTSHQEIAERLNAIAQDGDVVLLKGSRGLAMEKVLEGLMQRTA